MDFIRWIYYYFMLYSGIADTYRNEQFMKKSDWLYDLETSLIHINMNSIDKNRVKSELKILFGHYLNSFYDKLK
jgi:hypothetical protein